MARITGIGGIFLKARDPKALRAWYAQHLGIKLESYGGANFLWSDEVPATTGQTTWALFPEASTHIPAPQTAMVNYRVDDLEALIAQLTAAGIPVEPERGSYPYGLFAWITDPEGNRLELWQPVADDQAAEEAPPNNPA